MTYEPLVQAILQAEATVIAIRGSDAEFKVGPLLFKDRRFYVNGDEPALLASHPECPLYATGVLVALNELEGRQEKFEEILAVVISDLSSDLTFSASSSSSEVAHT